MDERKPLSSIGNNKNLLHPPASLTKHTAYGLALEYWGKKDQNNAEFYAIKAMKLGSENLAPQLLEKIALETKCKSTAFTLALYYLKRSDVVNAKHWAEKAIEFHSQSAVNLLAEIEAHERGLHLQEEVREINREMGLQNSKQTL